jgi:hypothetical protein
MRPTMMTLFALALAALATPSALAAQTAATDQATAAAVAQAEAPLQAQGVPAQADQVLRVGGDYTVTTAERRGGREFLVEFKAEHPSGRFDVLRLESDHVHVAVKVGQKLRLSAEILAERGAVADVRQVVLFFPSPAGHVPVWLLSNKAPSTDLRASKYLEMHSPLNDYTVM